MDVRASAWAARNLMPWIESCVTWVSFDSQKYPWLETQYPFSHPATRQMVIERGRLAIVKGLCRHQDYRRPCPILRTPAAKSFRAVESASLSLCSGKQSCALTRIRADHEHVRESRCDTPTFPHACRLWVKWTNFFRFCTDLIRWSQGVRCLL